MGVFRTTARTGLHFQLEQPGERQWCTAGVHQLQPPRSTVGLAGEFRRSCAWGATIVPTYLNTAIFDPFGTGAHRRKPDSISRAAWAVWSRPRAGAHLEQRGLSVASRCRRLLWAGDVRHGRERFDLGAGRTPGCRTGTTATTPVRAWAMPERGINIALATGRTRYAKGDLRVTNLGAAYTFGPSLMNLKLVERAVCRVEGNGRRQGRAGRLSTAHRRRGDQGRRTARYRLDSGHARAQAHLVEAGHRLRAQPVEAYRAVRDRRAHQQQPRRRVCTDRARSPRRNRASTGAECGMRHMF
jgi:hypothetical protein